MKEDIYSKLTSRKFWVCVAAGLASIATGIANAAAGNEVVGAIGIGCGIIAAGIYAGTEAAVDVARINSDSAVTSTVIERNINVTSNDKETAKAVMISETNTPVMGDE